MNPLEAGLKAVVDLLEREKVPYMVIGGIAVAVWGVPRATFDVDFSVWAPGDREANLLRLLTGKTSVHWPASAGSVWTGPTWTRWFEAWRTT